MASIFFTYEYSMVHICKCLYVEDPCRFLMISLKMTAISLFDGIWFFFLLLDSKKWVSFSRRFPIFSSPFRDIICMLPLKCRSFPFTHAYTITTTTTTTATTTTNVSYQSVRSWFFSFFPIFVMPVFRNIVQRSSFALFFYCDDGESRSLYVVFFHSNLTYSVRVKRFVGFTCVDVLRQRRC